MMGRKLRFFSSESTDNIGESHDVVLGKSKCLDLG